MVATAIPSETKSHARRGITIRASDVTGQRMFRMHDIESGTVGELIERLLPGMGLPADIDGRPLSYTARLDREGRHLNAAEEVGDVLREDDQIVVTPNIDAG